MLRSACPRTTGSAAPATFLAILLDQVWSSILFLWQQRLPFLFVSLSCSVLPSQTTDVDMGLPEKLLDATLLSLRGSASIVVPIWAVSSGAIWKRYAGGRGGWLV